MSDEFPALLDGSSGPTGGVPATRGDLEAYYPLSGGVSLGGALNVGGHDLNNVGPFNAAFPSGKSFTIYDSTGKGFLVKVNEDAFIVGYDQWGAWLIIEAFDGTDSGGEMVLRGAAANVDWHVDNDAGNLRFHHNDLTFFDMADDGSATISQRSTSSGLPVLILDQDDEDDTFINFDGTSAADGTKSISSDTSEDSAKFGAVRVEINGATKWLRVYDNES
jgi:hypothetical protein